MDGCMLMNKKTTVMCLVQKKKKKKKVFIYILLSFLFWGQKMQSLCASHLFRPPTKFTSFHFIPDTTFLCHACLTLMAAVTARGFCLVTQVMEFSVIPPCHVSGPGCLSNMMVLCVFGHEKDASSTVEEGGTPTLSAQKKMDEQPLGRRAAILFVCFFGLQASYLTWGVLQERIMTYEYGKTDTTPGEFFKNSQFLVFVNRILAFVIALLVIVFQHQPRHSAPLYKYSFSSFSNIMSSWFQYEALKFVSFPTQVRACMRLVFPALVDV